MNIASQLPIHAWDAEWRSYHAAQHEPVQAVESRYVMGTSSTMGELVALMIVRYADGTTRQRCLQEPGLNVDYPNLKGGRFHDEWLNMDLSRVMLQTNDRAELEEAWHDLFPPETDSPKPSTVDSETEI